MRQHRTRNLEIPGLVLTHHPGMTEQAQAACPMLAASAAARCMPVDISLVTALCSSTAAAVDVTYSLTLWMAFLMLSRAVSTSPEMPFRLPISCSILSVACLA